MFRRFSQPAQDAVVRAQDEARALGHDSIGTEHILLGLLADPPTIRVLGSLGMDPAELRAEVVRRAGTGDKLRRGYLPLTPAARGALEQAFREALALGDDHIGSEHVLLALVSEKAAGRPGRWLRRSAAPPDPRVRSILSDHGVGPSELREAVERARRER